jgi:hypothetical protein
MGGEPTEGAGIQASVKHPIPGATTHDRSWAGQTIGGETIFSGVDQKSDWFIGSK